MSQPKSKGKKETRKLKVMHVIDRDTDGNTSYHAKVTSDAAKLREAVGMGPKPAKPKEAVKPKDKNELFDEQRSVLKALHDLGGKDKDIHSMDIAKKLGFDKKFPKAPRAPVRNAMDKLHALHYVTSKKEGVKYSFRITDKGIEALKAKPNTTAPKDKEASLAVQSAPVAA